MNLEGWDLMHEADGKKCAVAPMNVTCWWTVHPADPESPGQYKRLQVAKWTASTCLEPLSPTSFLPPFLLLYPLRVHLRGKTALRHSDANRTKIEEALHPNPT